MSKETYPVIYVFNGKHGNSYYIANSDEDLDKIFFKEILFNNSMKYYDWMDQQLRPENPEYTEKEIQDLPEYVDKTALLNKLKTYKRDLSDYNRYKSLYAKLIIMIQDNDATNAHSIYMNYLAQGEYETYEKEYPTDFD